MKQETRSIEGALAMNSSQEYLNLSNRNIRRLCLVVMVAAMFLAPRALVAQQSRGSRMRYRIFDVGTFGGPNSQTNGTSRIMSNSGVVAGLADSDQLCPHAPGVGLDTGFISPAFMWRNGSLTNIGLLPGGCASLPVGINERGTIVGVSDSDIIDPQTGFAEIRADLRKDGHIRDLGTFGGHNGLSSDVNNHDIVVGGAENEDPDPFGFARAVLGLPTPTAWQAFAWNNGKLHKLGTLGGPDSFAFFINDSNEINGLSFTNAIVNPTTGLPTVEPFIWKNGRMRSLGSLGGTFAYVSNITNHSEIVGYSYLAGDAAAHAFDWKPRQGMKDLGALGGTFSSASWVNEAGEIVGGSTTNDGLFHAVRWRRGHIEDLGTVAGLPCSVAAQVNARGEIAGQSFDCADFSIGRATLWEPSGPGIDLNVFLPPDSDLALYETHFVNDRGEIAAVGVLPNGDQHIVVLIPCLENESEGCRLARRETATSQRQSSLNALPSRLSPESLSAVRGKMTKRFRGIARVSQK
jgi:probable HAF family extracellular repeat protein